MVARLPFGQSRNARRISAPCGPGTLFGTGGLPGCGCSFGGLSRVSSVTPTTAPAAATATAATVRASWARWDKASETVAGIRSGATIVFEAMATYRELLQQTKAEIEEVDAREAQELDGAVWVDVRRHDEWDEGYI